MQKCPACGEENPPKFRLCGYCGAALATAAPPPPPVAWMVRKTVTFLFCDLQGSTQLGERLDPESFHEIKERYFAAMSAPIVHHGGTIEKYIGDAIMAAFGVPRAREDDALRAARAALGMQAALIGLNDDLRARYGVVLANRTGISTGEVVANQDLTADQKLASGDAVNTAARLEQAAPANQIYIGESTYRLVRDAVEVEAVEPLQLKGKAEPVAAYRLVAAAGQDGVSRRHDRPLVGRDAELAALRDAFDQVCRTARPCLATVVGEAGMGKSRLVRELIEGVGGGARVLASRCLSYGEGITFWPLMMLVRAAAGIDLQTSPPQALERLRAAVPDAEVLDRLSAAIGLSATAFPLHEINWAARRFFEQGAAQGPLILLVEDIHWAEPALLGLLEYLAQSTAGVPLFILCTARNELLEAHPAWGTQAGALRCALGPLSPGAAAELVTQLFADTGLPGGVVDRIVAAADGNPLFAEQMLLMMVDQGRLRREGGRWVSTATEAEVEVPPTIQALLEARVDQLRLGERATVEPAAVIGIEFGQRALDSVAPDRARVDLPGNLDGLVRKQLIWTSASREGDSDYRFHHHLVHDTVYRSMTKRARANLHLAFVRWADAASPDRALEHDEVMGYHLEQAYHYLGDLGPLDAAAAALGRDGAGRLSRAGGRAAERGDAHAAAHLLQRAAALLPSEDPFRLSLLPALGDAWTDLAEFERATAVLEEARSLAERVGDQRVGASAQLHATLCRLYEGQQEGEWSEQAQAVADRLIPVLEALDAPLELAVAWRLRVMAHGIAGRYDEVAKAADRAIHHARAGGNERLALRTSTALASVALYGDTPVTEAIGRLEGLIGAGLRDRQIEAALACQLGQLKAMNGDLAEAQELLRRSRAALKDRGLGVFAAAYGIELAGVELRGGDLAYAEQEMREDSAFLIEKGETFHLSALQALLARVVLEQARVAEALALTEAAQASTAQDDVESGALWRLARASAWARQGSHPQAVALAREALVLAQGTESLVLQGEAWATLAEVLRLAGEQGEWPTALEQALALFAQKGDRASWGRWKDWGANACA